jgi:hypothetical protein
MMRSYLGLAMAACLSAACGRGDAVVAGDLVEGDDGRLSSAWVVGREGRAPISEGRFELRGVEPGMADLRLGDEDGERARLLIEDLPAGASLTLNAVAVDRASRLALPASIGLNGGRIVTVNGIRMAPPDRLPGRIDEGATVLARSSDADALLLRPRDERLPDLRVVVMPATEIRTPDGDPADPASLEVGDSVQVVGPVEGGFLLAERLVLPRRSVLRRSSAPAPAPARGAAPSAPAAAPAGAGAAQPAAGRAGGREPGRPAEAGARRGPPSEPPGRRGEGRGRGRGRD